MGEARIANVHVGNVTEFNSAALRTFDELPVGRVRACDEYGSMAPFYTADPGVVVVANADQNALDRWGEVQSEVMGWSEYQPIAWNGDALTISDHLAELAPVLDAVGRGATVVPWGETSEFRAFASSTGASAVLSAEVAVVERLDSKAHVVELFDEAHCAVGRPDWLSVPQQWAAETEKALVDALVEASAFGRSVMVKSHVGVGGTGSQRVAVEDIASREIAVRTMERIRVDDPFVLTWPVLVQICYDRSEVDGDLTADLVVEADGTVRYLGAARMLMAGTHYEGCVTIEEDAPRAAELRAFSTAVGELAAGRGYRGWFDVDFVWSPADRLVPIEVNARRTGPTIPMVVREVLGRHHTSAVHVASHDLLALDRPLTTGEALDRYHEVVADTDLVGHVVPTLVAAVSSASPYLGVAVAGSGSEEAYGHLMRFAKRLNAGRGT